MPLAWDGLLGPVIGATAVGVVTYLSTRSRSEAEVHKLDAEAERIRAETARILAELPNEDHNPRHGTLPKGWGSGGSAPDDYEIGLDHNKVFTGTTSAFIASRRRSTGFDTLMQTINADAYRGSRVRLRAAIKALNVRGWAGLWMRVDGPDGKVLGFDNMGVSRREITGTRNWSTYDVVLDVPDESIAVAFGLLLSGEGHVWLDDVKLDVVSDNVALTVQNRARPDTPENLDFEQGAD